MSVAAGVAKRPNSYALKEGTVRLAYLSDLVVDVFPPVFGPFAIPGTDSTRKRQRRSAKLIVHNYGHGGAGFT